MAHLERALDERTRAAADLEARLDVANRRVESLDRDLDACTRRANDLDSRLHQGNLERARLEQALETFRDVKSGKTWRPGVVFRKLLRRPENDGSDQP